MAPGKLTEEDQILQTVIAMSNGSKGPQPVVLASLITQDFDPLRFDAAASLQLSLALKGPPTDYNIISSPYNTPDHLLDLRKLGFQEQLLAKALTVMKPIRPDYATADYMATFNWNTVRKTLQDLAHAEGCTWKSQSFYTVIFRSRLNDNIDRQLLHDLDKHSHGEATISGNLLKYWFGSADEENRNLATCIWRNREDARRGGLGPWHKKARLAARELYAEIKFTTWKLVISDGAEKLWIEEWSSTD